MTELYTPFAANMARRAGDQLREARIGEATKAAYMGDPAAMQELYKLDPEGAMAIEQHQSEQEQINLDRGSEAAKQARLEENQRRQWAMENRDLMNDLGAQIGQFESFEEAQEFANRELATLQGISGDNPIPIQELTPEVYQQYRALNETVNGDDWERSGGPVLEMINGQPTYVQKFINPKTQEVRSVPTSTERAVTGWDVNRRGDIKRTEARAKTQEERRQDSIEAGLNSIYMMPDLLRAEELLKTVETGGLATDIDSVRRYFGDESLEVADMGELQVLLAQDLISKFELMTGVLSESDMKLLRDISAGTRAPSPVNMRLIQNVIRKAKNKIGRGRDAAKEAGSAYDLKQYDDYYAGIGETPAEGGTQYTRDNPAAPTSKADYDALPSGAYYTKNGKLKRKK